MCFICQVSIRVLAHDAPGDVWITAGGVSITRRCLDLLRVPRDVKLQQLASEPTNKE